MGRIAALLVVAHHIPGCLPCHGRSLERIQRLGPDQAKAQLVAMGQKARRHGQTTAQCIQRLIAAIGQHRIGLGIERVGLLPACTAPPHHGQAIGQRRVNLGQQACKPSRKQGLGTGQLANRRGLDQQATDQTPQ